MISKNKLFAKSDGEGNPTETLREHTEKVLSIASSLQIAFSHIPLLLEKENFFNLLFLATYIHDIGKSYPIFQLFLKKEVNFKHTHWIRHEILSIFLGRKFLEMVEPKLLEEDLQSVLFAVCLHHKDINWFSRKNYIHYRFARQFKEVLEEYRKNDYQHLDMLGGLLSEFERLNRLYFPNLGQKNEIIDLKQKEDITVRLKQILDSTIHVINNESNPKVLMTLLPTSQAQIGNHYAKYGLLDEVSFLDLRLKFFLKGCVNLCDYLGSEKTLIYPRTLKNANIDYRTLMNKNDWTLKSHQASSAQTIGNTLLTASTGSGKTEAALLWMSNNQNEEKTLKVFFILPYRASINAMYLRLKREIGDEYVSLLHYKIEEFLYHRFLHENNESIIQEMGTIYQINSALKDSQLEAQKMSYYFKMPINPVKILTIFQLLKNLWRIRGYEMQAINYLGSLFIIDEIHIFELDILGQMIAAMKFLVDNFKTRFFIMSATFPNFISQYIIKKMHKQPINHSNLQNEITLIQQDPIELRNRYRYIITLQDHQVKDEKIIQAVKDELDNGKKVLLICNTVATAQEMFAVFVQYLNYPEVILLHSRFCTKDRNQIEEKIFANKDEKQVRLIIGTQVVEVSLDIDYDLLFSEVAPFDSLVQRMGRVYRKRDIRTENHSEPNIYICLRESPYDTRIYPQRLIETKDFLKKRFGIGNSEKINDFELHSLVEEFYSHFSVEEKEQLDRSYREYHHWLNQFFKPGFNSTHEEKELFYRQFDSIEVIPKMFVREFLGLMHRNRFIEAHSLMVSLNYSTRFKSLQKRGLIQEIHIDHVKRKRLEAFYVIDVDYCEKRGLLL